MVMPMGIVEGEHDVLDALMRQRGSIFGMPSTAGLLGGAGPGGLLGRINERLAPYGGLASVGAQLLANSSRTGNFGEALGQSIIGGQKQVQGQQEADLMRRYREAQIVHMQQPDQSKQPASVAEYEYAKQNGYKGSFQDWVSQSGQGAQPADVQTYQFWKGLPPNEQSDFKSLQRQPTAPQVVFMNGAYHLVDRLKGTTTPISSADAEVAAAARKAEETAAAQARGEARGGIEKKGVTAQVVQQMLDVADPLIDIATGSMAGAGADKAAAFFGKSLDGNTAIAQLKIIQAGLMTNMPRMEGPQSDRDVQLYREAAGELGDPTVPREQKKAALRTIRALQSKYVDLAANSSPAGMTVFPNGSPEATQADANFDSQVNAALKKYGY